MYQNIKHLIIVSALAGCTAVTVSAQTDRTTTSDENRSSQSTTTATTGSEKADHKTTEFIKDAAWDNNMEIALAEVAARKAQNPELKTFAQKLQQDHMQAEQQLQPLAQKYGVDLSQAMKAKTSREVTKFEKEDSGAKWDQKFAEAALKSHYKDIDKFQDAANRLQAADVKEYATTMLPKLRQHFDQAVNVARTVGVDQSTIARYEKKLPASVGGTSEQQENLKGTGSSSDQGTSTEKH